jgi:hypothetical protein
VLIAMMSAIAAYSLFGGTGFFFLLASGLIAVGLITIVWKNWYPEIFALCVFLSSVPCLFQHNNIDLLNVLNESMPGISTTLIEALGMGLVIVLGYLLLKLLNTIQVEYKRLVNGHVEKDEIRNVTREKLMGAAIFVFFAAIIAIPVMLLADWLTTGMSTVLSGFSGNVISVGLAVLLLLAACLYWLGRTLKS